MIDGRTKTSMTDVEAEGYLAACKKAVSNDDFFKRFRSDLQYNLVLEHVSYSLGLEYAKAIDGIIDNTIITEIHRNDLYGCPRQYDYEINGRIIHISPTTLRYAKVYKDIKSFFKVEKIKSIAEIGVGYGGQARILKELLGISDYYLIDLPEVLPLAQKYLDKYKLKGFEYIDGTKLSSEVYADLVISNYAFSELYRRHQLEYIEKVINYSKCGYMTWNPLSEFFLDGLSSKEVLGLIPGSYLVEEVPLTFKGNCIVIWNME